MEQMHKAAFHTLDLSFNTNSKQWKQQQVRESEAQTDKTECPCCLGLGSNSL